MKFDLIGDLAGLKICLGWCFGLEHLLDLAGDLVRFGDLFGLEIWLGWIKLDIWLGKRFGWVGYLVVLETLLGCISMVSCFD